jgi:hypothetical protein
MKTDKIQNPCTLVNRSSPQCPNVMWADARPQSTLRSQCVSTSLCYKKCSHEPSKGNNGTITSPFFLNARPRIARTRPTSTYHMCKVSTLIFHASSIIVSVNACHAEVESARFRRQKERHVYTYTHTHTKHREQQKQSRGSCHVGGTEHPARTRGRYTRLRFGPSRCIGRA